MAILRTARTWNDHPAQPGEVAELVLSLGEDALHIEVSAPFHGDPPPEGQGSTWGLWEHEVVELFVLGPEDAYTEVELGPHGHYLVLQLRGERQVVARELPLAYAARIEGGRWTGRAALPLALLPERPWRGNAYAIHGQGAARRYLVHRPLGTAVPDFHAIANFGPLRVG